MRKAMDDRYVLEPSPKEHDRLDLQGAIYRDITRHALIDGRLAPGMRVLDIGCGTGDLSRLAADIVGPSGTVLGVDRDAQAIAAARARTEELGPGNVSFAVAEIGGDLAGGPFDALVGRFVLMHQEDPSATLALAARAVRPEGIVIVVESHLAGLLTEHHSQPFSPLYDRIVRWQCRVIAAAGADICSGLRLRRTFLDAGLTEPRMRMEAPVEGGPDSLVYDYVSESTANMMAMARQCGIEGFTTEEVETLSTRLRDQVMGGGGTVLVWPAVSAWCRRAS
ncbi:MAG: methyltransferase domain-containing protein [Alphaproteobacteria bacterium]|nr:methyltransferase domain-containing protein [Alphaproteobacteria bacterium]MDP6515494.1 methyltransferase domain-containing protein [Alphaproteobacteria bacterium]